MKNQTHFKYFVLLLLYVEKASSAVPSVKVEPGTGQCDSECTNQFKEKWYIWVPLLVVLILVCATGGILKLRQKGICKNLLCSKTCRKKPPVSTRCQPHLNQDPTYMFSAYNVFTDTVDIHGFQENNATEITSPRSSTASPIILLNRDPPLYDDHVEEAPPAYTVVGDPSRVQPPTYSSLYLKGNNS